MGTLLIIGVPNNVMTEYINAGSFGGESFRPKHFHILAEKFATHDEAITKYGTEVLQIPLPSPPPIKPSVPDFYLDGIPAMPKPSFSVMIVRLQQCHDGFWRYIRDDS